MECGCISVSQPCPPRQTPLPGYMCAWSASQGGLFRCLYTAGAPLTCHLVALEICVAGTHGFVSVGA